MLGSLTESFMAPAGPKDVGRRPSPLRMAKTFPLSEAHDVTVVMSAARTQRASTIQNGATPEAAAAVHDEKRGEGIEPDSFESSPREEPPAPPRASVDLDDLPIELVSLIDRFGCSFQPQPPRGVYTAKLTRNNSFIDSLSAKIHPTPPNVDNLAHKFQEFYGLASSHISTHIAALATRQSRDQSPAPSGSTRASAASILRAKAASIGSREKSRASPPRTESEQQMITADELANRKRARKALEQKQGLLEEAVERRLCEGIYDRIYRHHSTHDEAQDDKLRSKTAALAVVGIGPADLGVDLGELSTESPEAAAEQQDDVRKWLDQARRELVLMNESRYPLGKLNRLKSAHKSIVDTLSNFYPSSSADEIMPMLIYTLITLPPEKLNVISDLNFVNRFRWEQKIEGEAAYCLTSLEAAISFLETVDLSALRADEAPSGPPKTISTPATPRTETFPPAYSPGLSMLTLAAPDTTAGAAAGLKPAPSPTGLLRNRRLSDLVNTPAQAFSQASDAVINTFNAADQGLKTIGTSLEGSYKLFLGKFGKQNGEPDGNMIVPRTLDDARKLIGTPPPDDDGSVSGASSSHSPQDAEGQRRAAAREDRMLTLVGGKKAPRDHSADSMTSATSSKRVIFAEDARKEGITTPGSIAGSTSSNPALMDSVRNFGSSLNPMSRLSGIGGFRAFGRTTSTPAVPTARDGTAKAVADGGDLATVCFLISLPFLPPFLGGRPH